MEALLFEKCDEISARPGKLLSRLPVSCCAVLLLLLLRR